MSEKLYFAYGSNMNLDQMSFRCPNAEVVGVVRVDDYRLTFCGNGGVCGVATILPEPESHVDGVLWRISVEDEKNLDFYEGYPRLYGKELITVTSGNGQKMSVMAYTMNSPYKESPAPPAPHYLEGIVEGCCQNDIEPLPILKEAKRLEKEYEKRMSRLKKQKKQVRREDR